MAWRNTFIHLPPIHAEVFKVGTFNDFYQLFMAKVQRVVRMKNCAFEARYSPITAEEVGATIQHLEGGQLQSAAVSE